ncbi:MAG: hypothetical protein HC905_07325 [Bacteroidales bacterium]|nr:hypothetical protein [Bacteroidales bacterium]
MDNKEKQILVTIITLIVIFAGYALYVYQKHIEPDISILNNFQFWGKTFLIFIPVAIVSQIIIHIVFAIINKIVTNEDMPTINDERDKLIELKSIRISHWIFTFGFLLSMVTLVLEMPPYVMFITLITSGFISGIVSEIAKLYFYRKGF